MVIQISSSFNGNRSSEIFAKQHGAIGGIDRVDRGGFGGGIDDSIRSRRGTG
jgi:hypothetical protein